MSDRVYSKTKGIRTDYRGKNGCPASKETMLNQVPKNHPEALPVRFLRIVRERFSLDDDKADEAETIRSITRNIEFRGTNLWVLIFAIFIASIGLNVNSTAVIIGAMLISPLMGPIMGIGLGIGINDLNLILRSLKNLSIAVFISLLTSTVYFIISPLDLAQSELVARTFPTIWDTLIAVFGGLAGIVAGSRKEKVSNIIPGVAIATALMPPLCTAGFGLANGNWYYFAGAFYLFLINSVCISLSTVVIVRYLGYHQKEYPSLATERRVKNTILIAVLIALLPSTYLGYVIVKRTLFEQAARRFVAKECNYKYRQVVSYTAKYEHGQGILELMLVGEPLPADSVNLLKAKLPAYTMPNATLIVRQGSFKDADVDVNTLTSTITEEVIQFSQASVARKDRTIDSLRQYIELTQTSRLPVADLRDELKVLMPDVQTFTAARSLIMNANRTQPDTVLLVYAKFSRRHTASEKNRIAAWLKMRTKSDKIKVITE